MGTEIKKTISLLIIAVLFCVQLSSALTAHAAFSGDDRVVIVIDAGHGGASDPGACYGYVSERETTLKIAEGIKKYLDANGSFIVYMTRTSDVSISVAHRGIYANSVNADLLLSVHINGSPYASSNGVSAWNSVFSEYAPDRLSSMILSNLSALGFRNEGVFHREDSTGHYWNSERQWDVEDPSLGVLSDYYGIPTWGCKFGYQGIIIEHGYFSNTEDAERILSDGMIDRIAKADADAIISYYTGHSHSYEASPRTDFPSNCVFQGKQSLHCTVCRHRKNVTLLPAAPDNHYYYISSVQSYATCEADGCVTYSCVISDSLNEKKYYCPSHDLTEVTEKATGHDYYVTFTQERTHIQDGIVEYRCSKCGAAYRDIDYAEGHTFEYVSYAEPTCTESGGTLFRCKVCAYEYTDVEYALGHDYERLELLKEPTCTESGREKVRCRRCGFETELDIDPLGHDGTLLKHVDAVCEEKGYDKYLCQRCDVEYYEYIDALEHEFELSDKAEATCAKEGYEKYICNNCGEEKTEVFEKPPHSFEKQETVAALCESDGADIYKCTVCGEIKKDVTEALGHDWSEPLTVEESGFFKSGTLRYTCKNDESHVKEEIIPSYLAAHKAPAIGITAASAFVIAIAALSVIFRDRLKELIKLIIRKKGAEKMPAAEEKVGDSAEENADSTGVNADGSSEEKADSAGENAGEKSGDRELINKE